MLVNSGILGGINSSAFHREVRSRFLSHVNSHVICHKKKQKANNLVQNTHTDMGLSASKIFNFFGFTKKTRVLMLGLDASGKTTTLYKLKLGELLTTIPTSSAAPCHDTHAIDRIRPCEDIAHVF